MKAAGIGTWDLDIVHQSVWWDERCKELYGFQKDDVVPYDQVLSYMHPDDQLRVNEAVQWALNPESNGDYAVEFRTIGASNNQLRWLRCQGKALFNEQGIPYRFAGIAQDITTERLLVDQLQQEQQRLTVILEHIPTGVLITDPKGELTYGNQQVDQIFRHPFRESQHMSAYKDWQLFDPQTDEPYAMVHTLLNGETVEGVEMKLLRGDGTWGYAIINTVAILDKQGRIDLGVATFTDITERRQVEEALRQSEGRLRAVLESIVDGIYIGGLEGITLVNQPALDQLGFSTPEELNRHIGELAEEIQTRDWQSGESIPVERQAFARALGGERVIQDVLVRHRLSGDERVVRCAVAPVVVDDQVIAAVAINTDVTEQRRTEAALRKSEEQYRVLTQELEERVQQRTRELTYANQDLKRSNDNLQQFAYIASHDLQEPLRKVQGFSTLLLQELEHQLNDTSRDYLQRITNAGARMSTLIKDLLTYSRIATRQQAFGLVSLTAIVAEVITTLDWVISQRDVYVRVDDLPVVKGDESQLGQLFQNLLSNAIKFTPPNQKPRVSITYQLRTRSELPADVRPASDASLFHQISVSDEGIGFDRKYLDRIFEVFQRLHGRSEFSGTGIGLAISQRVVQNHGGAITADSQPGKGATFWVYLPA
ncbi:hypothetical protein GCM10027577_05250 [Spirosoma fluminis]